MQQPKQRSRALEELGCFLFPAFFIAPHVALQALGPWVGAGAAVASAALWFVIGPPAMPGLLPGLMALTLPINSIVVLLVSAYELVF